MSKELIKEYVEENYNQLAWRESDTITKSVLEILNKISNYYTIMKCKNDMDIDSIRIGDLFYSFNLNDFYFKLYIITGIDLF
jgi:hypothetical protein